MIFIYSGWISNTTGVSTFFKTLKTENVLTITMDDINKKSFNSNGKNNNSRFKSLLKKYNLGIFIIIFMMYFRHSFRMMFYIHKAKILKNKGQNTIWINDLSTAYLFTYFYSGFAFNMIYHTSGDNLAPFKIEYKLQNNSFIYNLLKKFETRINKKASKICFVSESSLINFNKKSELKYKEKSFFVYNGLHSNKNLIKNTNESNLLNIICVGSLSKRKGQEVIIDALNKLRNYNINLYLLGDGLIFNYLKNKCFKLGLNNVNFCGNIKNVNDFLIKSDLMILMSEDEGLPYSLIEGLSFGLPIISTATGGIPEIVHNESNGFVIEKCPEKLAIKIEYLMKNPEVLSNFGLESLNIFKSKFDSKTMVESYKKLST